MTQTLIDDNSDANAAIERAIYNARIPLTQIAPHPRNYKKHPYSQLARLCASLIRFGQVKSIVVQEGPDNIYLCVAGHGVTQAATLIVSGEYAAPADAAERVEQLRALDARVLPAHWSPADVEGYLVADNLIAEQGEDDLVTLAQILQEQSDAGYELESLGSSNDDLSDLLTTIADLALDDGEGDVDDSDSDDGEEEEDEGEEDESDGDEIAIFTPDEIQADAFTHFREGGFPYRRLPVYICKQQINMLANTSNARILKSINCYQVADTYHPHRFHAAAEGKKSPFASFNEDKQLQRVLRLYMEQDGKIPIDIMSILSLVAGTQACSNFRPGFALYLYREFCEKPDAVVLDTSTGYGGRLVGFFASGIANNGGKYIGIDPNVPTYEGNLRMARDLGFEDNVELINLPAEDVPHELVAGRCDFAFTSPPYFSKERYSDDDTQSWKRYGHSGDAWREGFLQQMLALQFAALKPGSIAIVNIADVTLRNKTYPLAEWTLEDGIATGFEHVETRQFQLQTRFGSHQPEEVSTEPVIVFRKPS